MRIAALFREPAQPVRLDNFETASSETLVACFGVTCPVHGQCARYAAVNRSQADAETMATCRHGTTFPLFVKMDMEEASQG